MLFAYQHQRRLFLAALVGAILTAREKAASCRHVHEVRREALNRVEPALADLVEPRHRFQQTQGIRVPGVAIDFAGGGRRFQILPAYITFTRWA